MNKTFPIVFATILACSLTAPLAYAQSNPFGGPGPGPSEPVGPGISSVPGPFDDITTGSTNPPDSDSTTSTNGLLNGASNLDCGAKLAQLRGVRASALQAVTNRNGILVQPVCDSASLVGNQRDNKNLDAGNSRNLISIIAQNSAMSGALANRGYRADHVVGVALNNGHVTLYVNRLRQQN